jgi:hypothetical protein
MKKQVRKNVPEKYLRTLTEMYGNKLLNKPFEIQNFLKEKKINRGITIALCEFKLLQKVGHNKWMWIGGKPTMEMALEVIEFLRLKSERCNQGLKVVSKPVEEIKKELVFKSIKKPRAVKEIPVQKKGLKLSLFWGLFNFQKD